MQRKTEKLASGPHTWQSWKKIPCHRGRRWSFLPFRCDPFSLLVEARHQWLHPSARASPLEKSPHHQHWYLPTFRVSCEDFQQALTIWFYCRPTAGSFVSQLREQLLQSVNHLLHIWSFWNSLTPRCSNNGIKTWWEVVVRQAWPLSLNTDHWQMLQLVQFFKSLCLCQHFIGRDCPWKDVRLREEKKCLWVKPTCICQRQKSAIAHYCALSYLQIIFAFVKKVIQKLEIARDETQPPTHFTVKNKAQENKPVKKISTAIYHWLPEPDIV